MLRLRDLEIALQSIERMKDLDVSLEQYPTPANIAAAILFAAHMEHDDIQEKVVCDLGCGDGIFALGSALLGAKRVIGIDVESKALKASRRNSTLLGTEAAIDWILADVSSFEVKESIDTVVSNPPFGVKKRGADLGFLKTAISVAKVTYSLHLAGEKNRTFLKRAIGDLGGVVKAIETFEFPIGRIYEFHKKERHLIGVDIYRIIRKECDSNG